MKEFVDNLESINQLAEQSAGFVWRLKDESGNATGIQAFSDPLVITNMSVWDDVNSLRHFVYQTHHVEFVKRRKTWFESLESSYYVLWWIADGHFPDVQEAQARLNQLNEKGDTPQAFSFKKVFPPPSI